MKSAMMLVGLLLLGGFVQAEEKGPSRQVVVRVRGIVCSFCAYGLEKNLARVGHLDKSLYGDGVLVDIQKGLVTLALDPEPLYDMRSALLEMTPTPVRSDAQLVHVRLGRGSSAGIGRSGLYSRTGTAHSLKNISKLFKKTKQHEWSESPTVRGTVAIALTPPPPGCRPRGEGYPADPRAWHTPCGAHTTQPLAGRHVRVRAPLPRGIS